MDPRFLAKRLIFPGMDLHTRSRYRYLPRFFADGPIETLDAGCGNGALAYAAYKRGNLVLGVTYDQGQVDKTESFFGRLGIDPSRLAFKRLDLYDLPDLGRTFDQIICSETLEHIRDDRSIVEHFHNGLRPGGMLHLCCPNARHPHHAQGRTDEPEDGGHVRDGYTFESYEELLRPAGFEIVERVGIGSPLLVGMDRIVRTVNGRLGPALAFPFWVAFLPLQVFDRPNPAVPFSVYVKAVRA